jgi:hypothetical protein
VSSLNDRLAGLRAEFATTGGHDIVALQSIHARLAELLPAARGMPTRFRAQTRFRQAVRGLMADIELVLHAAGQSTSHQQAGFSGTAPRIAPSRIAPRQRERERQVVPSVETRVFEWRDPVTGNLHRQVRNVADGEPDV